MENKQKKTPWYRISGIASDETKTPFKGQFMALLHLVIIGVFAYSVLFIALILFSAFIFDIYEIGNIVIGIAAFFFGVNSYQKTLERYKN